MSAYTTKERLLEYMSLETDDPITSRQLGALIERVSGMLDAQLGFTFGGPRVTATLDGGIDPRLWLPAPGASLVASVSDNGIALAEGVDYTVDPVLGLYITRVTSTGAPTTWLGLPLAVRVAYDPNTPPPALEEVCLEECVRRWQGRAAGFPDLVGVQGSNERRYVRSFAPGTLETLAALSLQYGVRNAVAM